MKMNRLRQAQIWEWQTARLLTLFIAALCIVVAYRAGYMRGLNECYREAKTVIGKQSQECDEIIQGYKETIEGYKQLVNEYARTVKELQQQLTMCQNELARVMTEYQNTLAQLGRQY